MSIEDLKFSAQSVLDDLWTTNRLPFKLRASKIELLGLDEYRIRFFDGRLHSVTIAWKKDDPFEDLLRVAVLAQVEGLDTEVSSDVIEMFRRHAA